MCLEEILAGVRGGPSQWHKRTDPYFSLCNLGRWFDSH